MSRKGRYFRERAASGKSGRAEDAQIRTAQGSIAGKRIVKAKHPTFTNGQIDTRISQMIEYRELTSKKISPMPINPEEVAWKERNNLMPQGEDGQMPATPFLVTKSIIYKRQNRLIPPYVEGNKMLGNPPKPKVTPKNLTSKQQKAAWEERARRYGTSP